MTLSVGILRVEGADLPRTLDASIEAASIAFELERRGHRVARWRVDVHHIELLAEELASGGCELFFIESLVPRDVLRRLTDRIGSRPCALFGPLALALLEQGSAGFALVDAPRQVAGVLADRISEQLRNRFNDASSPASLDVAQLTDGPDSIPNLLARGSIQANAEGTFEASSIWHGWSYESELLPFSASEVWHYRGPSNSPSDAHSTSPILAERGCVHGQPGAGAEGGHAPDLGFESISRSWSERAWNRVALPYALPRSCPFGICPASAEIPFEHVQLQAEQFWNHGVRSFEIRATNPLPVVEKLLETLVRKDRVPERILFRPAPRALRQCEAGLIKLLEAHPQVRFELTGLEFFLAGRFLGQPHFDTSQWEARSIARLLRRLADRASNLDSTSRHELHLFDPYTTLEEILDALQVIEEDAPFLKRALSAEQPLLVASRFSPIAQQIRRDGLLSLDGPFGLGFQFASEEIPVYRDLVARGLAPLLEAVGRLRRPPEERDRLAVEGRFRWFRELARFVISRRGGDRPATDGWGQVLAAVTGDLGLDQIRRR